MKTLTVGIPGNRYDIRIGRGLLPGLGQAVREMAGSAAVAVVTDENVWGRYREPFTGTLSGSGTGFEALVLPPGEANKTLSGLERVFAFFADTGLRRDGLVIAFGGGVIGDLAGFAAATYMRGVGYVQVPTTLLAQVDSSVGGKTAVNLPQGKNLAGAFYQPGLVLADTALLDTLPPRELRCGMAEVVKYGAIRSRELLAPGDLTETVAACCAVKAEIVERDERDTGERMLLNFGHTFGHAVEALGDFDRYSHGEAVAVGMVIAASVGEAMSLTRRGTADELRKIITANGLPVFCPYSARELLSRMLLDKKSGSGGVSLVLLRELGDAFTRHITFGELEGYMERTERQWKA